MAVSVAIVLWLLSNGDCGHAIDNFGSGGDSCDANDNSDGNTVVCVSSHTYGGARNALGVVIVMNACDGASVLKLVVIGVTSLDCD